MGPLLTHLAGQFISAGGFALDQASINFGTAAASVGQVYFNTHCPLARVTLSSEFHRRLVAVHPVTKSFPD